MDRTTVESDGCWNRFYRWAAIAALLIVIVGLLDAITSMIGGEPRAIPAIGIADWFIMLQTQRWAALGNLGIFNILTLSLGIPLYLALCKLHWTTHPAQAALALILFVLGVGIYISSNAIFSLMALSDQYATASEMQKPLLEAAGRALLARGADLSPGTFMGFFFTQCAALLMTSVVLRGAVFHQVTAWLGMAGFAVMSIFFVMAAFVPAQFDTAILISAPGGLLLIAYHLLLARRLFQLAG
jgi:hypothetical protein